MLASIWALIPGSQIRWYEALQFCLLVRAKTRVAVFAQGDKAEEASAAGADVVGMEDLAESVKGGDLNFDVVIATCLTRCELLDSWAKCSPKEGLMPNPRLGTVTADVGDVVKNAKAGQVRFRADKNGIIHGGVGKVGFEPAAIREKC